MSLRNVSVSVVARTQKTKISIFFAMRTSSLVQDGLCLRELQCQDRSRRLCSYVIVYSCVQLNVVIKTFRF